MTMRSFEEIAAGVRQATSISDTESLLRYAAELDHIGTLTAEALACSARGIAERLHGNYPSALENFHHALALYEELGDRSGVATVTSNIGNMHSATGDYPSALEHHHRALALHEMLGNRNGVTSVTVNIGIVHSATGDYPAALEHYHRALALHEELGDRRGVAIVTGNIGNVHAATSDYPAALEHYHRALALHEELDDRRGVARVTGNIGLVHFDTGDYPVALEHYHRALALHEELGDRSGVATVTGNIGIVHNSTGDYPAALEHYQLALAMHEELGERSGVLSVTGNIIEAYIDMCSDSDALALLAAMDAMQIDDPEVRTSREFHRAVLQERSGNLNSAVLTLQHALDEALAYGLRAKTAETHKALRDLAQKRNDFAGYIEHNNEFTRITEEINGKETTQKLAMQAKQREIDAVQREHQKHMAVLHSTLPKHIADRVARGEVVNDHYDNAAVIFLDIVCFTTISAMLDSRIVIDLLDDLFTKCDAICAKHNVVKIKTIGDSYMAIAFESANSESNGEQSSESAEVRAAFTAIEMMNIILNEELNEALEKALNKALNKALIEFRIGIHCGPVTAGVIGTARMQYDVWGDTVNVASRMESTSEPGRIHVSEAFASLLLATSSGDSFERPLQVTSSGDSFERPLQVLERGSIDIKGKGMMKTFWLQ